MIASRASWRIAWLAAALLVGVVLAFSRGSASAPKTPELVLPAHERIDDRARDERLRVDVDRTPGVLEDTPVDQPRHDRGF